jgi:hypothetical protein
MIIATPLTAEMEAWSRRHDELCAKFNARLEAMSDRQHKTFESRLRRMAKRQGLMLRRSRRRDGRALDYGAYWLIEPYLNMIKYPGEHGTDLCWIEYYLVGGDD